jgi:predicted O-methyltransferase YrrM
MTTDKYDLGYFDEFYNDYISSHSPTAVLEIGTQYGYSAFVWKAAFPNATIFAADINQAASLKNEERIVHLVGDAYTLDFFHRLPKNYFDLIIDDGPHTYESMEFFLTYYPDLCKPNGVCFLEDIIDISWTPKLCGVINSEKYNTTVIPMGGKQKTEALLANWRNGLDVIKVTRK